MEREMVRRAGVKREEGWEDGTSARGNSLRCSC